MKIHRYLPILMLLILLTGCEPNKVVEFKQEVVVNAYLFANSPVDWVNVSLSSRFGTNVDNTPVNTAQVYIIWNGNKYQLDNNPLIAGNYRYNGSELEIIPGNIYELEVIYEGFTVRGTTAVPSAPTGIKSSSDTINIDSELRTDIKRILVQWDKKDYDYSSIVITSTQEDKQLIWNDNFTNSNAYWLSIPTLSDYMLITDYDLKYYGENVLVVYSANPEYVNMFNEFDQLDLFSDNSNLKDGLGVFTAFSTDSVSFYVNAKN